MVFTEAQCGSMWFRGFICVRCGRPTLPAASAGQPKVVGIHAIIFCFLAVWVNIVIMTVTYKLPGYTVRNMGILLAFLIAPKQCVPIISVRQQKNSNVR